jgi:endogenous inhibitor of DNA gyrase (YacG/DUF329 family)
MASASQDRVVRDALVIEVAALLSTGEPTFFQYEGAIRHALRSSRCRDGWKWQRADDFAAHVLILAFLDLRAARPTWEEGQPVPQETGTTYRLCANCGKAIAKTRRKFCSQRCNNTRFMHRKRNEDRNGYNAKRRAEYYLHKLPETPCEVCGRPFEPVKYGNRPPTRFCSTGCRNRSNGKLAGRSNWTEQNSKLCFDQRGRSTSRLHEA